MSFLYTLIIVLIIYFIYLKFKRYIERITSLKEVELTTPLEELRESHAVSKLIKELGLDQNNITRLYEEICIKNPIKYENDPRIPEIISHYKNIIHGKIPDPEGLYVPSEYILNKPNEDYYIYIKNQVKYNPSLKKELDRLEKIREINELKNSLLVELVSKDVPPIIAQIALESNHRLNTYTSEDWSNFCKAIKEYLQLQHERIVTDFVELFEDIKIITDKEKFDTYSILERLGIPQKIIKEIILGHITIDQAKRAVYLVENFKYPYKDAIEEILKEDSKLLKQDQLREKYRKLTLN